MVVTSLFKYTLPPTPSRNIQNLLNPLPILLGFQENSPWKIAPRKTTPWAIAPRTISTDNCHLRQLPQDNSEPGQLPPDNCLPKNSHLGQLYCPRIITPRQLLSRVVLSLVQPAFLCGENVNLILWTSYITMNCNNRNYYISTIYKYYINKC